MGIDWDAARLAIKTLSAVEAGRHKDADDYALELLLEYLKLSYKRVRVVRLAFSLSRPPTPSYTPYSYLCRQFAPLANPVKAGPPTPRGHDVEVSHRLSMEFAI